MSVVKKVSVAVQIVDEKGRFLMSQRSYGTFDGYWQFPGGHVEEGEIMEEAAQREVMEEVGIEIEIRKPIHSYIDYEKGFVCTIYESKPCNIDIPQNPEPDKHSDWKWYEYIPKPRLYGLQQLVDRGVLPGPNVLGITMEFRNDGQKPGIMDFTFRPATQEQIDHLVKDNLIRVSYRDEEDMGVWRVLGTEWMQIMGGKRGTNLVVYATQDQETISS